MAEFPELGKNCEFLNCNNLDFLPFLCPYCRRTFCLKHRLATEHSCTVWIQLQNAKSSNGDSSAQEHSTYSCNFSGCQQKDLLPILCRLCEIHFCLQHRLETDHPCTHLLKHVEKPTSAAEYVKSLKEQKSSTVSSSKSKTTSFKNDPIAQRVAYMKLKQVAQGDAQKLPPEERLYFYINLPENYTFKTSQQLPICFSKTWTIGKCIDAAAKCANVPIKNNMAAGKKLRLFYTDAESNDILLPPDDSLEKLLVTDKVISDGTTLKFLLLAASSWLAFSILLMILFTQFDNVDHRLEFVLFSICPFSFSLYIAIAVFTK